MLIGMADWMAAAPPIVLRLRIPAPILVRVLVPVKSAVAVVALPSVVLFAPPMVSGPLLRSIAAPGKRVSVAAVESISPPPALIVKFRVMVTVPPV